MYRCFKTVKQNAALFIIGLIAFQIFVHGNSMFLVQGNVALYGQLINQGLRPYVDFYLHYPPGIPYLTAWLAPLHPDLLFPYHVIWIATSALTTVIIFALARRIFSDKPAIAYIAAALYTIWHIFWAKNIFWFHTPIPALTIAAVFCLSLAKQPFFLIGGSLLGIATLFKQPAVFVFLTFLLAILYIAFRSYPIRRVGTFLPAALFSIGFVLPITLTLLFFAQRGELALFIQHVVAEGVATTNTNTYGTITFLTTGPPKNLIQFALFLILIPYLKRVRPGLLSKESSHHLLLLSGVVGGSFFLFPHIWVQYAQMSLPFLAIITAYVLTQGSAHKFFAGIFLITFIPLLTNLIPHLQKERASDILYQPVIAWLQTNTREDERIFVCCTEPEIYWYSKRLPASRYTEYNGPMLATIDLNKEIVADLEKHKPRIVVEFADTIWERFNVVYLPEVVSYIHHNYTLKQEILPKVYLYERK